MSFGERVLDALALRGITREELYAKTELKSSYLVGYLKNPNRSPTLSTACKIALALDVSLDYLAGLIDEPRPIRRSEDSIPTIASDEQALIGLYRDTDDRGRETILGVANGQRKQFERGGAEEPRRDEGGVA